MARNVRVAERPSDFLDHIVDPVGFRTDVWTVRGHDNGDPLVPGTDVTRFVEDGEADRLDEVRDLAGPERHTDLAPDPGHRNTQRERHRHIAADVEHPVGHPQPGHALTQDLTEPGH